MKLRRNKKFSIIEKQYLMERVQNKRKFTTIEDIYAFKMSHEQISTITDCIIDEVEQWQNRPLQAFYPFSFIDCLYVLIQTERGVKKVAVYLVLSYDTDGCKDILGMWLGDTKSKHSWMQIFDELKARGV